MSAAPTIAGKQIDQGQWDAFEEAALEARKLFALHGTGSTAFELASKRADGLYAGLSSSSDEFAL